jgi:hypothetical protein
LHHHFPQNNGRAGTIPRNGPQGQPSAFRLPDFAFGYAVASRLPGSRFRVPGSRLRLRLRRGKPPFSSAPSAFPVPGSEFPVPDFAFGYAVASRLPDFAFGYAVASRRPLLRLPPSLARPGKNRDIRDILLLHPNNSRIVSFVVGQFKRL